jgi:hypothetical protein
VRIRQALGSRSWRTSLVLVVKALELRDGETVQNSHAESGGRFWRNHLAFRRRSEAESRPSRRTVLPQPSVQRHALF